MIRIVDHVFLNGVPDDLVSPHNHEAAYVDPLRILGDRLCESR